MSTPSAPSAIHPFFHCFTALFPHQVYRSLSDILYILKFIFIYLSPNTGFHEESNSLFFFFNLQLPEQYLAKQVLKHYFWIEGMNPWPLLGSLSLCSMKSRKPPKETRRPLMQISASDHKYEYRGCQISQSVSF